MKPERRPIRRMSRDAGIVALITPPWWKKSGAVAQPGSSGSSILPTSGAVTIIRVVPEM